ncbi:putative RNA-directed DNA polymerase from transposon X-element [Trichonephila clavipes]|nr:putative RNA-directed DNA polymerase from transposon X-element [Trichonephila clavipes]
MAVVIPILKPNSDDSNPQNYRPISLLSSLSKAYEFVILNRLNQHCLARNIIVPEQHGFVTKCSTVTQLLRVTELVHIGFPKTIRPRSSFQLNKSGWRWGTRRYSTAESIPTICNGIKVRRICRPRYTRNPFTLQVVIDDVSSMGSALSSIKTKVGPISAAYNLTMGSRTSSRYQTAVTELRLKMCR